ncbi:hypothetical protein ACQPXS_46710 (plasmid) [Streptomyces sp. CA-142005]
MTVRRYEEIVAEGCELVEQVTGAQFALGDLALEIEPMRAWGSPPARRDQ